VISAVKRTIESQAGLLEGLVQTDAAINPGNSGGPLVDLEGKVVAINTAIIPFAHGIGFAIPINLAKKCSKEIITNGISERPWLGIIGLSITPEISRHYELPVERGVLVTKVVEGSPAQRAGVTAGDIILRINGTLIYRIEDLLKEIHDRKVGEKLEVIAVSRGMRRVFELTLGRAPLW